jgi:hypothetical protein
MALRSQQAIRFEAWFPKIVGKKRTKYKVKQAEWYFAFHSFMGYIFAATR